MKFQVQKKNLLNIINNMSNVATRGIKREWDKASQITIKTDNDKLIFLSSNGHLDAIMEITNKIDSNLKIDTQGVFTVDVTVLKKVIQSLGKDDCIFSISLEGKDNSESLFIRDVSAKNKKNVKMEVSSSHHDFNISRPKNGFSYTFESKLLSDIVSYISRYCSKMTNIAKYQMICLHFLKNETRFVCGDGMRFAIESYELDKPNTNIDDDSGLKFLLPADQAGIITSVINDAKSVEFVFKNAQEYYVKPENGMTLLLKGIPNENYLNYEKHAYKMDNATTIIDIKQKDFSEAMNVLRAVEDKDRLSKGNFHSCNFEANQDKLNFVVNEGRYQADFESDVDIYGNKKYTSCYYHLHLDEVSKVDSPIIRFYCNDPKGTVIVELVDPDATVKTLLDAPAAKKSVTKSIFFFAAIITEEG